MSPRKTWAQRTKYSKELQEHLPRSVYLDRLSAITEEVFESGCRDDVPSPQVLNNITREVKLKSRRHSHEMLSFQLMLENKNKSDDFVLQKVFLHPKGVLLWSLKSIGLFWERCQDDIVYIDATGSIKTKEKGAPHFYVATYLTCDHTTASVKYFLEAFLTDATRCFGKKVFWTPQMIMYDGSVMLMQAICLSFAKKNLLDTLNHYYMIATGKAKMADFQIPILHRCLSHIMKNAKEMCRK